MALLTKSHKILVTLFLPHPLNVLNSVQAVGCLEFIAGVLDRAGAPLL